MLVPRLLTYQDRNRDGTEVEIENATVSDVMMGNCLALQ
jgi:hypothetical protein